MKNLLFVVSLALSISLNAQQVKSTNITYKNYTTFPAYPLLKTDSSKFNSISALSKGKPTVVIYFSPTCSHCQHQAEELTASMKDFKNVQFLMVSTYPLQDIKQFVDAYGLVHFSNIMVGYDPGFAMGRFFELKSLPGIFIYDKKGMYKSHFETNVHADELLKAIEG